MKRGQLKIQETAFMLLGLVLLAALIFVFYSNIQLAGLYKERNRLAQENAIAMLTKLTNMPEFYSSEGIDYDKVLALKNVTGYDKLWQGILKIQVMQVYPKQETITVYDSKKKVSSLTYSAFTPLCQTMFKEGYSWQDCKLGKLLVTVEQAGGA